MSDDPQRAGAAPQYWVVGAKHSGVTDTAPEFINDSYWKLWWTDAEQPRMARLRDQIRTADRIAIKQIHKTGPSGSEGIEITALGLVLKGTHGADKRVSVNWVVTDLHRIVESHGCFASIHGPFAADDAWTREVFQL